jgi:hypothetical protein
VLHRACGDRCTIRFEPVDDLRLCVSGRATQGGTAARALNATSPVLDNKPMMLALPA